MTIAVCYVSPEGVVLGADSTSSVAVDSGLHYFDFAQKVLEIGESSTLGLLTWGLGGLGPISYRTLCAQLSDGFIANPPSSVTDVAQQWANLFWSAYTNALAQPIQRLQALQAKAPFDPNAQAANQRSKDEESEYVNLRFSSVVGFCIAGYVMPNRTPEAAYLLFDPLSGKPAPQFVPVGSSRWWGVPNIIARLLLGSDENLKDAVLKSGKWGGTPQDLQNLLEQQHWKHATLPIRDAVDFVHSCISCTIKAMKFSSMAQICGGPIEIAVITTDRKFRWVRHKQWDAAITDGALS